MRWLNTFAALAALSALILFSPPPGFAEDEETSTETAPSWGIGLRAGYFGLPDWLLDMLFEEHPSVDGSIVGGELRYFGSGGPSGTFSAALTFDVGNTEGNGVWRENADDTPVTGGGGVDIIAGTLTLYWDLWSKAKLHPYFGLGLGVGYADGFYERDGERIQVEEFVPVVHVPAGLVLNLGPNFGAGIEGRIIDGVSWGGFVQLRF